MLKLSDPAYTERLASFLQSVGQAAVVAAPDAVELSGDNRPEVQIYLRVWNVLYPNAAVEIES